MNVQPWKPVSNIRVKTHCQWIARGYNTKRIFMYQIEINMKLWNVVSSIVESNGVSTIAISDGVSTILILNGVSNIVIYQVECEPS